MTQEDITSQLSRSFDASDSLSDYQIAAKTYLAAFYRSISDVEEGKEE